MSMVYQAESEETMEQRMSWSPHVWKSAVGLSEDHTFGAGKYNFVSYFIILVHLLINDGRSVHNTRIERLWYDVTHAFGQKWKNLFIELETHHDLDPRNPAHIWLLHHLFLPHINTDAQEWADAWNSHHLQIRGE
jgi:hypothetical protein